jgi:putative flippase GtrA
MSVDAVRRKSQQLQDNARRRIAAFYAMGAANAGIPLVLMWFLPELRLGLGYLVLTAVFLVSFVRRRSGFRTVSPSMTPAQGLAFCRELLARERDFRRDSARWFTIGPALNIIVLTLVYVASPLFHGTTAELAVIGMILATHVFLLARIVQRLRKEARGFQTEIDALDGLAA